MAIIKNAPIAPEALNIKFKDNTITQSGKKPVQTLFPFTEPPLLTLRQFVSANPAFTMGSLRNYIFYEDINGLKASGAIKRIGRKILIDPERFYSWVATNPQPTGGAL